MLEPLRQLSRTIERIDLGGWTMLLGGLLLLAVTLLTPAWQEATTLSHRQTVVATRLTQLRTEQANYHRLIQAVDNAHPMVLQRLAWHQLNLKPAGAQTLNLLQPTDEPHHAPLDHWLIPTGSRNPAPVHVVPDTTLLRWTTGPHRPWLLVGSVLLIGLGLLSSLRPHQQESN